MVWIVGVDEAGYGPNLGPFVMTLVACRADDALADACLWQALRPAIRRAADAADGRPAVDDSKAVYNSTRGLAALEHGVLAALWHEPFDSFEDLSFRLLCRSGGRRAARRGVVHRRRRPARPRDGGRNHGGGGPVR